MQQTGVLDGQRLELIDGDLLNKMGQNPPHAFVIRALQALLARYFSADSIQVQSPIEVSTGDQRWSLPEPDIAVLTTAKTEYRSRFPRGDELALAVEVSDTTLRHDASTKRDLYARAGVLEYWIVDVAGRKLIVHRRLFDGEYREVTTLAESETVALGQNSIAISSILP